MSTLLTPATLEDIKPPVINNKRTSTDFKRTQKHYDTKISNVLKSLQEMDDDDDDGDGASHKLGDFIPPPKPISMGSEKKEVSHTETQQQQNIRSNVYSSDGLELNNLKYTYPDETKVDSYYKHYVPNYTPPQSNTHVEKPNHIQNYKPKYIPNNNNTQLPISYNNTYSDPNILLEKINYMIHLLEDKNDMKTKSTFEEILLYCFLGIFTIFLVDSFSRVGKYIR